MNLDRSKFSQVSIDCKEVQSIASQDCAVEGVLGGVGRASRREASSQNAAPMASNALKGKARPRTGEGIR